VPRVTNLQNLAAGIPAEDDRLIAAFPLAIASGLHARTGILPGPVGYVGEVTLLSSTSIQVNPFRAMIAGTQTITQGDYRVVNDAVLTRAVAPSDPTLGRIDLLVTYVRDTAYVPNEGVDDVRYAYVLPGTPAAVPVAPTLPPNALLHGTITVPAGAGTVTYTPNLLPSPVALGGIRPAVAGDTLPGAYDGQWREVNRHAERWNATSGAWEGIPPGRTYYDPNGLTAPSYVVSAADEGRMLSNNGINTAATTVYLPPASAFPPGGFVDIVRHASGTITIAAQAGITLAADGSYGTAVTATIPERFGVVRVVNLGGAWYLYRLTQHDTGWTNIAVNSGFSANGTPAVRKINGIVYLRSGFGNTGVTAAAAGFLVGTIPAGFRPEASQYARAGVDTGDGQGMFVINPTGTIELRTGATLRSYYRLDAVPPYPAYG
jgi:hypothetical protein